MSTADRILRKTLEDGMKVKLYYKDIFKACKDKLAKYIEIEGGQTDIISQALAEADALLLEKE